MDNSHVVWKRNLWFGDIKGEIESTVVAAQDQALSTNCSKEKILKEEIESTDRLTSGCPILAKNEYIIRHDEVHIHVLLNMQEISHGNSRKLVLTHNLRRYVNMNL
jgi:hypothetical protein